jgi:hypothetical protein
MVRSVRAVTINFHSGRARSLGNDHEQVLRMASAISAVPTGCCLRYGLFASILRQPVTSVDAEDDAFRHYYGLQRSIGLSTTEDMIHPTRTWLVCRIGMPEPTERYFVHGSHRWQIDWAEVIAVEGIVLPTDPVLLSLQTIAGLTERRVITLRTQAACDWPRAPLSCCWIAWRSGTFEQTYEGSRSIVECIFVTQP